MPTVTPAMLIEEFNRTCLARNGWSFDEAIRVPVIELTLMRAAEARLKAQASHAGLSIHHSMQEGA